MRKHRERWYIRESPLSTSTKNTEKEEKEKE
jgi:hypothetical protein